jgi:hypothetical protein
VNKKEISTFAQQRILRTDSKENTTPLLGRCPATGIPRSYGEAVTIMPLLISPQQWGYLTTTVASEDPSNAITVVSFGVSLGMD